MNRSRPAKPAIHVFTDNSVFAVSINEWQGTAPQLTVEVHALASVRSGRALASADMLVVDIGNGAVLTGHLLDPIRSRARSVPLIVLSDANLEHLAREVVQLRADDWITHPVAWSTLLEALSQHLGGSRVSRCQVYGVIGVGGGAGATSLAVSLADALTREGSAPEREICLVDLDFAHGSCGSYLDITNVFDFDTIFSAPERIDLEMLELVCQRHQAGFNVFSIRNPEFLNFASQAEFVLRFLDLASYRYQTLVLDLPSYPTSWLPPLLSECDQTVLVAGTSIPALKAARELAQRLKNLRNQTNAVHIASNREKRYLLSKELSRADVREGLDVDTVWFLPEDRGLHAEALNRGVPPRSVRASTRYVRAVRQLAADLTSLSDPAPG